jgi:hypothetical protein
VLAVVEEPAERHRRRVRVDLKLKR